MGKCDILQILKKKNQRLGEVIIPALRLLTELKRIKRKDSDLNISGNFSVLKYMHHEQNTHLPITVDKNWNKKIKVHNFIQADR